MIHTYSNDPDVADAATRAEIIISEVLANLPVAESFDYGGHELKIGDYGVCERCSRPIAEAQAAHDALKARTVIIDDETVAEHLQLASELFAAEARAATIRAELHNGRATEPIVNTLLGHLYQRNIHDSYDHSHHAEREPK